MEPPGESSRILWRPGGSGPQGGREPNYLSLQPSLAESPLEVKGYRRKIWKTVLCHFFSVLTLGIPLGIFHWKPHLEVRAKCTRCPLRQADWVVLLDQCGRHFTAQIQTQRMEEDGLKPGSRIAGGLTDDQAGSRDTLRLCQEEEEEEGENLLRFYFFEGLRYIWVEPLQAYCKASVLDQTWTCLDIHLFQQGLSAHEQSARRKIYGANLIDVPVKSYLRLLKDEILNLFYLFQVFSVVLWICEEYYSYASCIVVISIISVALSLYVTRKQNQTLRDMAKVVVSVQICRAPAEKVVVNSMELVPGDVLVVPPDGMLVPCDAALLTGECMVNESLLTGESTPVTKTPLPMAGITYSSEQHKRHTLFCGTQITQARPCGDAGALAVVTRTVGLGGQAADTTSLADIPGSPSRAASGSARRPDNGLIFVVEKASGARKFQFTTLKQSLTKEPCLKRTEEAEGGFSPCPTTPDKAPPPGN